MNWNWTDELAREREEFGEDVAPGALFNMDSVLDSGTLILAQTPTVARSVMRCGFEQVVAIEPNASGRIRLDALAAPEHEATIRAMGKIILAFGTSKDERKIAEEAARRLGFHRCWQATLEPALLQPRVALREGGSVALKRAIEDATPYPIEGVQYLNGSILLTERNRPPPPIMSTGIEPLDAILNLPADGALILWSGRANHGKTTAVTQVIAHTIAHERRRWLIFSPESGRWQRYAAQIAQTMIGRNLWEDDHKGRRLRATDQEVVDAEFFLRSRVAFVANDAEEVVPTLDYILERATTTVLRDGTTDLLVDPWNALEVSRGNLPPTEWLLASLTRLRSFAVRYGCNVHIVAHPVLMRPEKGGEKHPRPTSQHINGGSAWDARPDLIIITHTPTLEATEFHIEKSRFARRWGRRGDSATARLDVWSGRYVFPTITEELEQTTF